MASLQTVYWEDVHFRQATLVDLHAHPSLKVSLFHRTLGRWNRASRAFDPFDVHADFPKLRARGVDVLLSSVHVPEAGMVREAGPLRLLRYPLRGMLDPVLERSPFDVTMRMLDDIEAQVRSAVDPSTGKPPARIVRSIIELDELLAVPDERPIAMTTRSRAGTVWAAIWTTCSACSTGAWPT
jgi:hypothetical protein